MRLPQTQVTSALVAMGKGEALHLPREPVEHSRLDRLGVNIEPEERTLMHSGASSRSRSAVALFATATRA
jgi:hypothetical protein